MNLRQSLNSNQIYSGLRGAIRNARLSAVEIAFLAAALVFTAVVVSFYLMKVQPLNSEVSALENRERELSARLNKMNDEEKKRGQQAANAEKILDSLGKFENYLKPDSRGQTQIINEIDSLGKTNNVQVNESSFRRLEGQPTSDANENPNPQAESNDKKLSIFPVLGIDTTVKGDYPNLRRFLAALERSKQFLIINSLAFQGEADRVVPIAPRPGGAPVQSTGPAATPVSLRIELDTYFQKSSNTGQ